MTEIVLHDVDQQLCELVKKLLGRIRAPIGGGPVEADRLRVILSLFDVAAFFDAIGAGQDVVNHFAGLATVFCDLNEGARPPRLFVPAPSGGNRPEVSPLGKLRGEVAAGIDILNRSGMTEAKAVKEAATNYPGLKWLLTKKGAKRASLESSIKSWYKRAKQAAGGGAEVNPQMLQAFTLDGQKERLLGALAASEYEQFGRQILKHAETKAKSLPPSRLPEKA
jgi:hypothetical protein